jgi:tRNA (adenine57-N1/adenine58-N1)-methyltransferase
MAKRILIKKEKRAYVEELKREVVLSHFEKYYVDDSQDFHMKYGIIRKDDLKKKSGSLIMQNKNEFIIFDADFLDDYKRIRRLAQIITLKDIGAIIVNTGITRDSKVLDCGAGSGAIACYVAKIAKKVVSYDIDERSLEVARENIKNLGIKNAVVKKGDVYDSKQISEKGFDVFILDVPEAWKAISTLKKSLRIGGFVAVYLPNISQMQEYIKSLTDDFIVEKVIEIIEREWAVDAKRSRPATKDFSHTAFLAFARRIK